MYCRNGTDEKGVAGGVEGGSGRGEGGLRRDGGGVGYFSKISF